MAQRLVGIGYLRSVSVDPSTRLLQAHLSTRLSKGMVDRLDRLTSNGRWLEAGAAGQVARAACTTGHDLDLDLVINAHVRFADGVLRELSTSRRLIPPAMCDLLSSGRLIGAGGVPVTQSATTWRGRRRSARRYTLRIWRRRPSS